MSTIAIQGQLAPNGTFPLFDLNDGKGLSRVANAAALTGISTLRLAPGVMAMTIDTSDLYVWSGSAWVLTFPGDVVTQLSDLTTLANSAYAAASSASFIANALAGVVDELPWKPVALAVATSNITLSGSQTVDGKTITDDVQCLVVGQTTPSQNGLYTGKSSGAWARANGFNNVLNVLAGSLFYVQAGTKWAGTYWQLTNTGAITVGTTALTFARLPKTIQTFVGPTAGNATVPAGTLEAFDCTAATRVATLPAAADSVSGDQVALKMIGQGTGFDITVTPGTGTTCEVAAILLNDQATLFVYDALHSIWRMASDSILVSQLLAFISAIPSVATDIQAVANTASGGSSGHYPNSDHVHSHGSQTNGAHHAVATESANGFESSRGPVEKGNFGATPAIDWTAGDYQKGTLNASICDFSTGGFTPPTRSGRLTLKARQDATGGRTAQWPSNVHWGTPGMNAAPPDMSGDAGTTRRYLYFDYDKTDDEYIAWATDPTPEIG